MNSFNLNVNFNSLNRSQNRSNEQTLVSNNSTINFDKDIFFKSGPKSSLLSQKKLIN